MPRVNRISVIDYTPFGVVVVACNVALPPQLTTPTPRHRTFSTSEDERVDDIKDLATDVVLNYGRTVFVAVNVTNSFDAVVTQVASLLTLQDPEVYQPCVALFRGASTSVNMEHLLHEVVLSHMLHESLNVPTSYVDVTPNVVTVGCRDPAVAAAVNPLLPAVDTQRASTHYMWHRRQLIDEQKEVGDLPEQLPPTNGRGYVFPLLNVHPSYTPYLASFLPRVLAEIGISSVTAVDCAVVKVAGDVSVVSARLTLDDPVQALALREFTMWMNDELVVMTHSARTTHLPEMCAVGTTRECAFILASEAGYSGGLGNKPRVLE